MNSYTKKKVWKIGLILFAMLIALVSLFVTNRLVKDLAHEEKKKMEIWAYATNQMVNIQEDGDFSLAIKVMETNENIPIILADENDSILNYRNLNPLQEITEEYLKNQLKIMKDQNDPIEIQVYDGYKQLLYYKDSILLTRLKYYPFFQLLIVSLFIFMAYLAFNSARKAEQNQVWAGMAKETAHQIGTPLSSLMAWIELLKSGTETKDLVLEMERDLQRLETITDRFSKIGSKPALESEDIVGLVNDAIHYLETRLSDKISFQIQPHHAPIIADVNRVLLNWVIENICKNAVDAMKGKGLIQLDVQDKENHVEILIHDNGPGIDSNLLSTIFQPGVTSKKRGWGLGLSLSKRIIEDYHKGKIFVKSSGKEDGTTFCIALPKQS